jgi:hypothetical protein
LCRTPLLYVIKVHSVVEERERKREKNGNEYEGFGIALISNVVTLCKVCRKSVVLRYDDEKLLLKCLLSFNSRACYDDLCYASCHPHFIKILLLDGKYNLPTEERPYMESVHGFISPSQNFHKRCPSRKTS